MSQKCRYVVRLLLLLRAERFGRDFRGVTRGVVSSHTVNAYQKYLKLAVIEKALFY
jgi:hypothetical protein